MRFSFVILTWNRRAFLESCIAALVASISDFDGVEIIVMDNGSTDGTDEFLANFVDDPRFRLFRNSSNEGLNAYKKLIREARGDAIVVVDDDVIEFPAGVDTIFEKYLHEFRDFGYLALNVVQDGRMNGAKPPAEQYSLVERNGLAVEEGPTGGWCTAFRREDYRRIRFRFRWRNLDMKTPEDWALAGLFSRRLGLRLGIIRDHRCLHACGPYFSREFGYLDRDIEKYRVAGLDDFVREYEGYKTV